MKSRLSRRRFRLFAALVSAAAIGCLAALGSVQASPTLPKLSLSITSSSISAAGSMQSGGVNVVTTNGGKKEASAILFKLAPGVDAGEVEAFLRSKRSQDPNAAGRYGSIVFDAESIPAHGTSEVQTYLTPGEYLALGATGHGRPRLHTTFTITAAADPVALPRPEATISSIEFDFRGPSTIHRGELVRFRNQGYLVHMDIAFPVKSRQAAKEVAVGLKKGDMKGLGKLIVGPPVSFQGVVSHGAFQQEKITAKPGWYVQVCFMETQEHQPHTLLGMERPLRITR
jgi:hypothetical protein